MIKLFQGIRKCLGIMKQEEIEEIKETPKEVYEIIEVKSEKPEIEDSTFLSDKNTEKPPVEPKKREKTKGKKEKKRRVKQTEEAKHPRIEEKEVQLPAAVTLPCINLEKKPLKPILKKPRKYF
jgi:hypothetical protein